MDEDLRRIFAKNLNRYLEANDKTQADMARYMHVSTTTAAKWCNAQTMPRVDKIQALCDWFICNKTDLLEDKPIYIDIIPSSEKAEQELAKRLLTYYRALPEGERSAVNKIMGIKDGELE